MKNLILLVAMFIVMGVATSPAKTILIDGAYLYADAAGVPVVNFYTTNFPGWTVTTFNGDDTANATVQATIAAADVLVMNRRTGSGGYAEADGDYYKNLTIPIIFHTSYVTRNSRLRYEGGEQAGVGVAGAETTVTDAGATFFKVPAGTYDWHLNGFDATGTGSVGTGTILATIEGNHLAVIWHTGDTDALGRIQAGPRLLFNLDAWTAGSANPNLVRLPETTEGLQALVTAVKKLVEDTQAAHEPVVTPDNGLGQVGNVIKVSGVWQVRDVVLGFKAGEDTDPETGYPVNPDIAKHNIYLQTGAPTDPNLYLYDSVEQVHDPDPMLTNPNVSYGPLPDTLLKSGTAYQWKVEEVLKDPNGIPYPNGSDNNIMGEIWTFTTASATPEITTNPVHTLTDTSGNATLSIVTTASSNNYRWFKVVGVQDVAGGETDDIKLTDSGIYSGTTTKTLVITGAASNGSDDARVYAIAYNGDPESTGIPSAPSAVAWFWYPHLVHYYPFETVAENVTPDTVGSLDATLMQEAASAGMPVLNTTNAKIGSSCLELTNVDSDPNGQYAQLPVGVVDYKDMTISAWIYPKTNATWARVLDFGNGTTDYMFLAPSTGSVLRFASKVGNGTEQLLDGTAALTAGQWSYVTVTVTGNTGRMYLNGTLIVTNTAMSNDPISVGAVLNYLGKSQYTADPEFNGMIDDLKIYNYARTTEQVAQDYLDVQGEWVCNRELYNLPYDFDGNCRVDLGDFAIFAATWLDSYRIYPN